MRTLVALGLVLLTGCVQAEDAGRRAWLQSLLVQDNQLLLERERALTAGKFRKMSSRPYDFLRGALVVYLADAARPDAVPTRFGTAAASRVLVLSANGNLRALLSGLVFAVAAQASLGGVLSPLRENISSWWVVDGGPSRSLLAQLGVGPWDGLVFATVWLITALFFA